MASDETRLRGDGDKMLATDKVTMAADEREIWNDGGFETPNGSSDDQSNTSVEILGIGRSINRGDEDKSSHNDAAMERNRYMNLRHKYNRRTVEDRSRPKRETARNMCRPLKQWLYSHRGMPYPNKTEKLELSKVSKMTVTQVSNWFANARRRLKNTVSSQPGLSWERRIKLYNRNVVGNQERLSISSDDTLSDDDDEEDEEENEFGQPYAESYEVASPMSLKPSSTRSGSFTGSEEKDGAGPSADQCTNLPGKFKQGILQRYLNDSYNVNLIGGGSARDTLRLRNTSGSLSSHDYEEMSVSSRSTPIKEHHTEDDLERSDNCDSGYSVRYDQSIHNDLSSEELSAVLVLTQFATSRRNSVSPRLTLRQ